MKLKLFKCIYITIIVGLTVYILVNTFISTKVYSVIDNITSNEDLNTGKITTTNNLYTDDNMTLTLNKYNKYDTAIYVVDVVFNNKNLIKTYFANNTYGKNITDYTSTMAKTTNAILAINGDYYGVQESGYVIKNGTLYRSSSKTNQEDLVIYKDGSFKLINESDYTAQELIDDGAYNVLSFGPGLIENNEIIVSETQEVGKAMASNPRTAIGQISDNHYVFVVSDGRTSESEGLTLYELANFMKDLGCNIAYNLDGGGSSTMYFNGKIINNPTTNGKIKERKVSDIVYVGY